MAFSLLRITILFFTVSLSARLLVAAQPSPTWEWLAPLRAPQTVVTRKIVIDATGNSYVIGEFYGQASFGTNTLTSRGWYDVFVAKYNPTGNCLWARQIGPAVPNPVQFGPTTQASSIGVDKQGNVYITGTGTGRTLFNQLEITTSPDRFQRTFLAKYSADGTVLLAKAYDWSWAGDVALDTDGALYVGHGPPFLGGQQYVLVSKLDGQGTILWSRGGHNTTFSGTSGPSVKVGPNHEVYLFSYYRYGATIDVDGQSTALLPTTGLTNSGTLTDNNAVFLARYAASGTLNWVRTGYSTGTSTNINRPSAIISTDLAVDEAGNAIITGSAYAGGTTFGSLVLPARGNTDTYVVKYDAQGQLIWGKQEGSQAIDVNNAGGIAVDKAGNAYLLSNFYKGQVMFGNTTLNGNSQYNNMALVKYTPQGQVQWAITQQGGGNLTGSSIAANRNGDVYITGSVWNTIQLGNLTMTVSSGNSAFIRESMIAKLKSNFPLDDSDGESSSPFAEAFIPNIITPNKDGRNEQFKILGLQPGQWSCMVYNRWGKQVFYTPSYQQDWQADGLWDGIYYYVLESRAGQLKKGWVEVRR